MEKVSVRLAKAMEYRNMSSAELSRRSSVGTDLICHYLKDHYSPKTDKVGLMAKALNVNPVWLMGFDTEEQWDMYPADLVAIEYASPETKFEKVSTAATDPVLAELITIYNKLSTINRSKLLIMASEMLDQG